MTEDGTIYALKRVNMAGIDGSTQADYLAEIELLRRLQQYQCIIRLVDHQFETDSEFLFIVLEYGEIDLARLLDPFKVCLFEPRVS